MGNWDLSILYTGVDTEEFRHDACELESAAEDIKALADACGAMSDTEIVGKYISCFERFTGLMSKLAIYLNLRYNADTRDVEAASELGRIMSLASSVAAPSARLDKRIADIEDIDALIDADEGLEEYRFFLNSKKRARAHMLADGEEAVFAKLNISGASAWGDMHSALTSGLQVDMDGEKITLSAARNLAYSPDAEVRRKAYLAELASYDKIKDAVAFALNSIKLQVISECEMRGYESALDKALYDSRMKKETLDALFTAMEEYMPAFRKYLKAKAKALGHAGALPWYDLFAPMGKCDTGYTVEDARDYLLGIFSSFDTELHDMVKCAFDNSWIDFYPREGKVGGAFDCGVPSAKESRVLTNFDGSFSDIVTLAHELGHAFHDRQVFAHSILTQEYTMPVAETASTFNEVLVVSTAIERAKDREEKLALIEGQLMDATQIICDIYSRFLFEKSVFDNRSAEFMNSDRLCELMLNAQKRAYGDGLDPEYLHPYMWLCKGHYYSGSLSYYNFPYAFGGLFARGLYAKYKAEGAAFVPVYKKLLYTTGVATVEDAAMVAGIDLTSPDFWRAGLKTLADEVEEFCAIVASE